MRVTYEIITPESAEHGDAAERGFILPASGYHLKVPIEEMNDFEDSELQWDVRDAEQWLGRGAMEDSGRWFNTVDPEQDFQSGAETFYSLHPDDKITPASYNRLARIFCY